MKTPQFVLTASVVAAISWNSQAEDVPEHKLSDWRLGSLVSGDKVDLKNLDGKVVAIEYWGTR